MQAAQATGTHVPAEFTDLVKPHVQSFDYFVNEGLHKVAELLDPLEVSFVAGWSCMAGQTCCWHE